MGFTQGILICFFQIDTYNLYIYIYMFLGYIFVNIYCFIPWYIRNWFVYYNLFFFVKIYCVTKFFYKLEDTV